MLKVTHSSCRRIDAVRFACNVNSSTTEEFALALLHISNNVREYGNRQMSVYTDRGNTIYLVCPASKSDGIQNYLKQFGDVTATQVAGLVPSVEWDIEDPDDPDWDCELLPLDDDM